MDPPITTTHNNKPTSTPVLLNGKKHHHHHHINHPHPHPLYRECLKNHAAALGGHAVDGCGEFMPSPTSATCDPSSLTCAACGCHRNFHRRLPDENHHHRQQQQHQHQVQSFSSEDDDESDDEDDEDEGQSGPHMLLALSAGLGPTTSGNVGNLAIVGPAAMPARKRFRSRFSPEQKEKMYELSERLGWRMQRRDDGVIEERCREIGVGRGVFKVWMHNNKHNYVATKPESNVNANGGATGHGHGSNWSENATSA